MAGWREDGDADCEIIIAGERERETVKVRDIADVREGNRDKNRGKDRVRDRRREREHMSEMERDGEVEKGKERETD